MNKEKLVSIIVIVLIILSLLAYCFIRTPVYNVQDLYDNKIVYSYNQEVGDRYVVSDEVTEIVTFSLPQLGEDYVPNGEMVVYTAVWFSSNNSLPLLFIGNNTNNFIIGESKSFEIESRNYSTLSCPNFIGFENDYVAWIINDVSQSILKRNYSILSFTKSIIGTDTVNLTIDEIELPNEAISIYWSEISAILANGTNALNLNYSVYDADGQYLGMFNDADNNLDDIVIENGHYISFQIGEEHLGNSELLISGDGFPYINTYNLIPLFDTYELSFIKV
ncbi:MAG: hypothetical protein KAS32_08060 [Candidatus Peribacteraceae bacterium]|nr:hypothetical protein [Candidatus Peribacteraceae bacterium]